MLEAEYQVCKSIHFISDEQISIENWKTAMELVRDIDVKDISYIAFSKQFRAKVWSGDKELINGLAKKRFTNFISTNNLWNIREEKMSKI